MNEEIKKYLYSKNINFDENYIKIYKEYFNMPLEDFIKKIETNTKEISKESIEAALLYNMDYLLPSEQSNRIDGETNG